MIWIQRRVALTLTAVLALVAVVIGGYWVSHSPRGATVRPTPTETAQQLPPQLPSTVQSFPTSGSVSPVSASAPSTSTAAPSGPPDTSVQAPRQTATAPTDSSHKPFLGQERPFAPGSVWNTPTRTSTRWYDLDLLHRTAKGEQRMYWMGRAVSIFYARPTDPVWTLKLPASNEWAACNRPAQAAKTVQVRAPAGVGPAPNNGGDNVVVLVDGTRYYEIWLTTVDRTQRTITGKGWGEGDIRTGSGIGTSTTHAGVRASNFSWAAGALPGHDVKQGRIDHALAIELPYDMLDGRGAPVPPFIPPATCGDNGGWKGPIKSGSKIGIPAGVAQPAGLTAMGSMVFHALQKYGAYVGDFVGGQWPFFVADANTVTNAQTRPFYATWEYNMKADYQKLEGLLRVADYQP